MESKTYLIGFGVIFPILIIIFQAVIYKKNVRLKLLNEIQEQYLSLIRSQRHDLMNDFQVIYGYIQLNKNEKALEYIRHASQKSQELGALLRINFPELSVLFLKLKALAELKEIEVEFEITEDLTKFKPNLDLLILAYCKAYDLGCAEIEKQSLEERVIYFRPVKREKYYGVLCEAGEKTIFIPFAATNWLKNQFFIWKRLITIKKKGQNFFE
jgi:hypothetical protein